MISHKHKCIFIHISKCAGTSVEKAFGLDISKHQHSNRDTLFGWDNEVKLDLQHATPQQLFDHNLVSREEWDTYYKFIIYRNTWSKLLSDYFWTKKSYGLEELFQNYLNRSGCFNEFLNDPGNDLYCGDHLKHQKDYFFLNKKRITYDRVLSFDKLNQGFKEVINDLGLSNSFFDKKENVGKDQKKHYSFYYNKKNKKLAEILYKDDIDFFGFKYQYAKQRLKYFNFNNIK
jgi:hypothetical protein